MRNEGVNEFDWSLIHQGGVMSYAAERWARSQKVGNASAKFVLIELANALNKDDVECYPGIDTLEETTELNRKTVLASTKLLEEKGFIKKRRACERGKQRIYYSFPAFNPADWEFKKESTENGTLQSPKSGTYVEQSTKNGTLESPKNGTQQSTENGILQSTKNGTVTGNKNREIEQVIETHDDAASESTLPKKDSKPVKTSSQSRRTRLTIEELPNDWREYCEKVAPEIDPDKAWEDFKDYWQVKAKDPLSADWKRTWQANVRKLHSGPDWMKGHLLKASVRGAGFKNAKNVTQTPEYRERLQACCRGEGRAEKLADDGVTIIVD